eukprot:TRINITY_DN9538_c0_g1_i1.p1 TRINITY_DN9538_c0_g1~~TRINITY_DN9538_c0_g1_i1.p1  ORF type:complete len:330 (-),score=66.66 TRINITY_DN9538_c0_g1_i1:56-1045(-)
MSHPLSYKAIVVKEFGNPDVLQIGELPFPKIEPEKVIVKVYSVGVNPVETYIRSGNSFKPNLPWTPGNDGSGVVVEVGSGVTNVKVGDRVYLAGTLTGSYAEYTLANAQNVYKIPDNISFEQGASLGIPYGTAYYALFIRCRARPTDLVLVHGASGGVGIAALQLARALGLRVIGTAGTEEGRKLVKEMGAEHALDHRNPEYLNELRSITNGVGPDIILEMLANVNLDKDLKVLAPNGRIAIIGNRGSIEINPRDIMSRSADVVGVYLGNATVEQTKEIHGAITNGLFKGTIKPMVYKKFALSAAAKAHEEIINPPAGALGKIVLDPWA